MTGPQGYYPPPPQWYPPQQPRPHRTRWWQTRGGMVVIIAVAAVLVAAIIGGALTSARTKTVAGPTTHATVTARVSVTATATRIKKLRPTIVRTVATRTHTVTETYTPPPKPAIGDGTYEVGRDIKPGEWRSSGQGQCYWERDSDLSGGINSIIANNNFDGPAIVYLNRGEYFQVSGGCQWRRD